MCDPLQSLLARAERSLGGRTVVEAALNARAIIGVPNVPDAEDAAGRALEKLRHPDKGRPSPAELAALELVIRLMRPAPLSCNGLLDPLPTRAGKHLLPPEVEEQWDAFRVAVRPWMHSIGRIDSIGVKQSHVGTGFLVGPDLLATNRHVLGFLTCGVEVLAEGQAIVLFHQELASDEPAEGSAPIVSVAAIHPMLDLVLLRIRLATPRPALEIDDAPIEPTHPIAAVGYPSEDGYRNPLFGGGIFGNSYGVKRGAYGEVLSMATGVIYHDSSTTGGNFGSPIFSLRSHRVIGLHRSGFFLYRNEAIAAGEMHDFIRQQIH